MRKLPNFYGNLSRFIAKIPGITTSISPARNDVRNLTPQILKSHKNIPKRFKKLLGKRAVSLRSVLKVREHKRIPKFDATNLKISKVD